MIYSVVLVSSLARNILDDLQALVAELESHLVDQQSYNLIILLLL